MYIIPTETWAVDRSNTESTDTMIESIVGNLGTTMQFIAVGSTVKGEFDRGFAYCHPLYASRVASAPDMAAALEALIRWTHDFEHGDPTRARTQKPVIFDAARKALRDFHGRDLPLFAAA